MDAYLAIMTALLSQIDPACQEILVLTHYLAAKRDYAYMQ